MGKRGAKTGPAQPGALSCVHSLKLESMRIGVLGTGVVGRAISGKLRELGHDVLVGSRSAGEDAVPFADAAAHGELVFNCTNGNASLEALRAAGEENLAGKVLVDVANALDFSQGSPPVVGVAGGRSLGEQIQDAFPDAKVVKTLNTVNSNVMVDPSVVPGEHELFISGNDADAKAQVVDLLESFGWPRDRILDLGGIAVARGQEAYVALWVQLMGVVGSPTFNIHVAH
jgi:predicted dinucleotide-binding enzyme